MEAYYRTLFSSDKLPELQEINYTLIWLVETNNLSELKRFVRSGTPINLQDGGHSNLLHKAIQIDGSNNKELGIFLIENGINFNSQTVWGETPLYLACLYGDSAWIYILLYYGANPLIHCHNGMLLVIVYALDENHRRNDYDQALGKILFNYTFDDARTEIDLHNLVNAMKIPPQHGDVFTEIFNHVSSIIYNKDDLKYLRNSLTEIAQPRYFQMLLSNYEYIIIDMLETCNILNKCLLDLYLFSGHRNRFSSKNFIEILNLLIYSDLVDYLILNSDPSFPTIHYLVSLLVRLDKSLNYITNTICILLTHGLNVTSIDLDTVYVNFGYCELFEILLHMNIEILEGRLVTSIMTLLCFDINVNFEKILQNHENYEYDFVDALDYFASPELKEICLERNDEVVDKVRKMPRIPLLVELSRNAARKFITNFYKIGDTAKFYTIVNNLPIGKMNQRILSYATKLY